MTEKLTAELVISHAEELLTCSTDANDLVGLIRDGAVAIAGDRIIAAGTTAEVEAGVDLSRARRIDASGKTVMPGFVDAHTHVVFGESRLDEYVTKLTDGDVNALRARGIPVGIHGTVDRTRPLDVDELIDATMPRLREMLAAGTTTMESKSGYGLTVESELILLRANQKISELQPIDVVSTFMGAHGLPRNMAREDYVAVIVGEMLPQVAAEQLAEFNDVWCDVGQFSLEETRLILQAGLQLGIAPKVHLDQLSHTGAADLCAELSCVSVDHLNHTTASEMRRLAVAGVTAVAMPGIDFATAHQPPVNCRQILESGMRLALATDICPGGWIPSMQLIIALACRLHQLSPAEAIRAATIGGAHALSRELDTGSIEVGKRADLLILDVARHEELAYKIGRNAVLYVVKSGQIVVEPND
jgi:imidazolonepropionase